MTFLLPLHHLKFQPNIPAGMNVLRICSIADSLRNGGWEVDPPIAVQQLDTEFWLVRDGRHRVMASWIAGRSNILCVRFKED